MTKGFFIASTGQNVGKTTICLGLLSALQKRGINPHYIKPVGQELGKTVDGTFIDKDALLVKEHFSLTSSYLDMSPILITKGFTTEFLDGKRSYLELSTKLLAAKERLNSSFLIAEGTGHVGVGSLIGLSNAKVAKLLNLPMILVVSGGIGSTFDELSLNKSLCDIEQAPIAGIILNRVQLEKKEKIEYYINKACKQWNIPLLGSLPINPLLETPCFKDLESLLGATYLSGESLKTNHFPKVRLAEAVIPLYKEIIEEGSVIITTTQREDIVLAVLESHKKAALILSGPIPPKRFFVEKLKLANIPALYTESSCELILEKIHQMKAKIQKEDLEKIQEVVTLTETYLSIDTLISL